MNNSESNDFMEDVNKVEPSYCINCGRKCSFQDKYCYGCGKRLPWAQDGIWVKREPTSGFKHQVKNIYNLYFNIEGTINRKWYFWSFLSWLLVEICLIEVFKELLQFDILSFSIDNYGVSRLEIFMFLYYAAVFIIPLKIALVIPLWGLCLKRCHDINMSGKWTILLFIPLIGVIYNIFLMFVPSAQRRN